LVSFKDVGTRLRSALRSRGYNKYLAFAAEIDVSPSTVTRWCDGHPIKLQNLIQICEILDISLDWLVLGTDDRDLRPEPPRSGECARLSDALRGLPDDALQKVTAAIDALRDSR